VASTSRQPIVTYRFSSLQDLGKDQGQSPVFATSDVKLDNIPIYSVTPDQIEKQKEKLPDIDLPDETDGIICFEAVSSTQSILEKVHAVEEFSELSMVVTSNVQIEGRGRRSVRNWTSPVGCAMVSFTHRFKLDSILGKKLGFLQHLVSLSIVNSFPEIESLRIKWPNDVYYKHSKIAGLIVNCSLSADQHYVSAFIGCGINVDNDKPTDYLNRILKEDLGLDAKLTTGQVISKVINNFKKLTKSIKTEQDFIAVKKQYVSKWMHSNQEIVVDGQTWQIIGVDDQGFLLVKDVNSGVKTSVGMDWEDFSLPVVVN